MKADIYSKDDIALLITTFYSRVREDTVIARYFSEVDWKHHTPIIIDFWSMILLGEQSYVGNPLLKHLPMKLAKKDFDRWLLLFHATVDDLFHGQKADEAKQRATSIAGIFQIKMNIS